MKHQDIEQINNKLVAEMNTMVANLVLVAKQHAMAERAKTIGRKTKK